MKPLGVRLKLLRRWAARRLPWHQPAEPSAASRSELWPKVHDLIARQLDPDKRPISPTSDFAADLGFDSLDAVEFVLSLEEEFNLEIPDEDEEKLKSVEDLLRYLEERLTHGQRPVGG